MLRPKGYTLMEVLLIIALISVIFAIGMPSMKFISNIKEDKELDEFRKDLLHYRNKAIIDCENYNVYLDYVNNCYYVTNKGTEDIIKKKTFTHGIRYKNNYNSISFRFTSSGAPSSCGTIYLVNSRKEEFRLSVTPVTGSINLEKVK